jgi:hypothetical protein
MSSKDLANIYESLTSGDSRRKHLRMSDLYGAVINESAIGPRKGVSGKGAPGGMCTHCGGTGIEPQNGWNQKKQNRLARTWLQKSGFVADHQTVMVAHYMSVAGVDWDVLNAYVAGKDDWVDDDSIKESTSSVSTFGFDIIQAMTPNNTKFDLKAPIINEMTEQLHLDPGIADQLYYNLFNMPFQESTVSVGKGELIICLFSAATKGDVGDCMVAGKPATTQDDGDADPDAPKEKSLSLKVGKLQIEVKVGKARVISARGGKFKDPSMGHEKSYASRRDLEGNIVHPPPRQFTPHDRAEGESGVYDTSDPSLRHLSNEDYVDQFGDTSVGYEAFNKNARAGDQGIGIKKFLEELNNQDPYWSKERVEEREAKVAAEREEPIPKERGTIGPQGIENKWNVRPNYALREELANVTIVWSYANPADPKAHGFDYLLAILSSGVKAKGATKREPDRNIPATPTLYDSEEGNVAAGGTGDKAEAFAIACKGEEGFTNIYQAVKSKMLAVERVNPTTGRIDGDGMYMYFAGSNTEVKHEPGMGMSIYDD